ncbi:MAG: stage sporulation protein [Clostridia bacterium]|uniref:SpoIVB peptidase n=1 Tax=Petroclostridium xylanilyticum TaxID=1792311 RepID=UPI000B995B2F|nr:SpoIVB peptidase [Petroclostridium xylanilyticum]MBZ4645804.1 stage sporulation protein [Clostridia bacterium]
MDSRWFIRKRLIILFLVLITVPFTIILQIYLIFPNRLMLLEGEEYVYDLNAPISIDAQVDKSGVLSLNGDIVEDSYKVDLNSPLVIKSEELGNFNVNLKLFGVIPIRSVEVDVVPKATVVPCGNTIGVKLYTDGILVIGTSDFTGVDGKKYEPWREAGIKEGDIIESIGNTRVEDIEQLVEIVEMSQGNELNIDIRRKGKLINTKIVAKKSIEDRQYKLGLWVRDSTAGIGTLTFFDPNTNSFGALGHGITDIDTGQLLTVGRGDILKSSIISIRKGMKGKPGELKGVFMQDEPSLGKILENNDFGIFGKLYQNVNMNNLKPMPIGLRTQVKEGPAYILSNVQGQKIEKFDVEIQKVMRQSEESCKGMIIKITDPALLEKTGGIVQGMSGSPIIQDGKVIGAVTHVFVNDPTRGYGIFIEWMLKRVASFSQEYEQVKSNY